MRIECAYGAWWDAPQVGFFSGGGAPGWSRHLDFPGYARDVTRIPFRIYRIAGIFGGEFNLAVYRSPTAPKINIRHIYPHARIT